MGRTRPPTASDMRHERHGVVHKGGGVHDGSSHDRHRPGEAEFPAAWCACGRLGGVSQAGVARSGSRGTVVASALRGGDGGVRERAGPGSGVSALGREVRLAPPVYVKPFVKRRKSDAAEAEAIWEAALRPTMRFVAVKSAERQAHGVVFRTRDLPVRQRTRAIHALRGHLAEFGVVTSRGPAHAGRLAREAAAGSEAPEGVRGALLCMIDMDSGEIAEIEQEMRARAAAKTARLRCSSPSRSPTAWRGWRGRRRRRRNFITFRRRSPDEAAKAGMASEVRASRRNG